MSSTKGKIRQVPPSRSLKIMMCPPTLTRIFIHHTATHSTASSEIKSQVGLNVLHLVEDLDRVMAKYKATFPIGAKSKASKSRKKKEPKKTREKRIAASESRRTRTCIIFRSLGGELIDDNYETEACGIPQLETVDLETLSLFKSRTDLACLRTS